MSFFRRVIAELSGLNTIGHAVESSDIPAAVDARYGLRPTDHLSRGQVVVAAGRAVATDGLSSEELHARAQQALQDIRALAR
ncbi:hypothetical protein Thiowin_04143 [Thiorhodovibrio winogradskyi]|uniref:Uncharacterized protein n=1 Tax=Thiorhodovibrio winogradskyi TaxID=77007 RepID=A0ABZ0SEH3_9GAMM|nr:hypothetical protein [Thiorhodovibrio winogradskyi]